MSSARSEIALNPTTLLLASMEIKSREVLHQSAGSEPRPEQLSRMGSLTSGLLDAIPQQICILDSAGVIAASNSSWRNSPVHDGPLASAAAIGENYLAQCSLLYPQNKVQTDLFAAALIGVLSGTWTVLTFEYSFLCEGISTWYHGSATRFVDRDEVAWVALVHTDVTQAKSQTARITRLSHIQAILAGTSALVLRVRNRDELFEGACKTVTKDGHFMMAWIGIVEPGENHVRPMASAGNVGDFIATVSPRLLSMAAESEVPVARVVRSGTPIYSNDVAHDPNVLVKPQLEVRGIRSLAILPLIVRGSGIGVFAIYCADINVFDADETRALNQLAGEVSFALEYLEKKQQLDHLIHHDPVTGLPNRRLFFKMLDQVLRHMHADKSAAAVLLIDFTKFQGVTDALGRAGGDTILRLVATRVRDCLGDHGTIARMEGAEFALIMSQHVTPAMVTAMAEEILAALARRFEVGNQESYLTAHVGIAIFPDDGISAGALLASADAAVYSARLEGRHNFKFYTVEMNEGALRKSQLERDLRKAIGREEFILHYQPKVDSISGAIVGLEALIRWASPTLGMIPPLNFIPALEETGLIVKVGEWVIRTACRQIVSWQEAAIAPVRIAVNLSARQFQEQGLAEMVSRTLIEFKVPARYLELEITESLLMRDTQVAVTVLEQLRALGIHVSIDDFGTGYSSLSYLKRLPLDALKIDRSFISDVTVNPEDAAITRAIITMAHNLNLKVIAEGVETQEQLAFLRANNCDEVQGYLFSKPLSADAVTKLICPESDTRIPIFPTSHQELPTLLLVDDDRSFRSLLAEIFAPDGYRILTAGEPKQAFDVLALHDVDIIISDENMPGMQGVEFLKRVRRMYPSIVRVMMTGQNDAETVTAAVNEGEVYKFFVKQRDEIPLRHEITRLMHRRPHALLDIEPTSVVC